MTPDGLALLEAHLNGETLTDEQCVALSDWVCASPEHAKLATELTHLDHEVRTIARADSMHPLLVDADSELFMQALGRDEFAQQIMEELIEQVAMQRLAREARMLSSQDAGRDDGAMFRISSSPRAILTGKAWGILTAAAAVLLAGVVALMLPLGEKPSGLANNLPAPAPAPIATPVKTVATLTATHNATWGGAASAAPLAPGTKLHPGTHLTLTAGFAEITTIRGAIAIIEAPATIELTDSPNAIRLHAGKLVGICETAASKGFLVQTATLDITDFGTRFGVDVAPYRFTEVHVHQGEVRVASPKSRSTRQSVVSNQAIRMESATHTLAAITPRFEKFDDRLATRRLFSTGFDLAEGSRDPRWQIVADGKGPLDQPIALTVQYSGEKAKHFPARNNDPAKAQSLLYPNGYPVYEQPAVPGLDLGMLTARTQADLPDSVDLGEAVLYLSFASNTGLNELRINGKPVDHLIKDANVHHLSGKLHKLEIPVDTTALQHGKNTIEIDLPKPRSQAPPSFYFYAEIRPFASSHQNTGENRL